MKSVAGWIRFALAMAFCLSCCGSARAEPAETAAQVVYVIPIRGMIESALLYVIRRGVAEAEAEKADAIIFVMDTPGGTLDAAENIVKTIDGISVPTFTFVEKNAFSAGAIIALATDNIYMAPGSVIGDAMPILMSPIGGPQEMPEAIQEKMVSAVSAKTRAAAEQGGHDPELAEAMVRREKEYKIGDEVISKAGELLTLTNVEAERLVGDPELPLLSYGTVEDLDALLKVIGLDKAKVKELEVTTAERLARFIAGLAPIFLIVGLLGIYIEVKTPGFGLPGIVGACSLALFFWGHHIAGLAGMEDMIIFFVGFLLLVIEVFLIPGFGVVGATGIALMVWAILSAMIQHYPGTPWYQVDWEGFPHALRSLGFALAGTAVAGFALAKILPRTKTFSRLVLAKATARADGYTASPATGDLVGLTGRVVTPLRPAGTGMFGDRRLDVVTRGEFVPDGQTIRIVESHGSRIVVEPCEDSDNNEGGPR